MVEWAPILPGERREDASRLTTATPLLLPPYYCSSRAGLSAACVELVVKQAKAPPLSVSAATALPLAVSALLRKGRRSTMETGPEEARTKGVTSTILTSRAALAAVSPEGRVTWPAMDSPVEL